MLYIEHSYIDITGEPQGSGSERREGSTPDPFLSNLKTGKYIGWL